MKPQCQSSNAPAAAVVAQGLATWPLDFTWYLSFDIGHSSSLETITRRSLLYLRGAEPDHIDDDFHHYVNYHYCTDDDEHVIIINNMMMFVMIGQPVVQ